MLCNFNKNVIKRHLPRTLVAIRTVIQLVLISMANLGLILAIIFMPTSAYSVNVANATVVTEAQMTIALTGSGVAISNLTITNPGSCANFRRGVGRFTNGTIGGAGPVLGVPTGVVVANSDFANVSNSLASANSDNNTSLTLCSGTTSDADMVTLLSTTNLGEYAAIEFDVIPAFSTLAIPFQFASEEFPEYVCSNFTDIVGIFVSGPGIVSSTPIFSSPPSTGTPYENYAKTAAGNLSSINWVNTGSPGINSTNLCVDAAGGGSLANAAFYTDNSNGNNTGGNAAVALTNTNIESDGYTNTLFQPINVVPGQTYRVKIAVADAQDRAWDSAAFIHPLFSSGTFAGFDYGDAPNSYRTLTSSGGPGHGVNANIFIGTVPDNEITGIPSVGADGDDNNQFPPDDEDGVASFPVLLSNASTYSVNVNVTNNSGSSARLVGWIDFDGSGSFESDEGTQTLVANGTTSGSVALNWSGAGVSGMVGGSTYARFRLSSDLGLSILTTGGAMSDGEVEDFTLPISSVTFNKYVSTNPSCSDTLESLVVTVGTNVYYCYSVTNPNASAFTVTASSDDQGHDISALHVLYPPAATNTVIVGPLLAGGAELPTGAVTVNNASVTANIGGSNVTVNDSASLTVSLAPPSSGVKQLYFDDLNTPVPELTRDPTNTLSNTQSSVINGGGSLTLNQGIVFTSPFTVSGGNDITVQLIMRRRGGGGGSGNPTAQVQIFNGNTGVQIGATNSITTTGGGWQTVQLLINVASDVTLNVGDFIRTVITNTSVSNRRFDLRTLNGGNKAELRIQTATVINVNNIAVYANPWPDLVQFSAYTPGSTISIRAIVADPFGNADITGASITIDDPNSPPSVVTNAVMNSVDTPTAGTRLFEYAYTIPAIPEGDWPFNVTATEGFEGSVTHTQTSSMLIGTPSLSISKNLSVLSDPINASNPKAIPGAIVEYSIAVSNTGFGYVDTDTLVLTDPIAANARFFFGSPLNVATFIDGATLSGLSFTFIDLASALDDIDFSNDGGATFVTPTTDSNGFDTTSPAINFIRINPKGEFNRSDGVSDPSMQINFRVRME